MTNDFVGRNAAIETNAQGGKGSVTYGGFHLGFPAMAALEIAHVVKQGAERYAINNWRLVSPEEHYNHAVEHLMRLGDPLEQSNYPNSTDYEDHAAHAACRLMMFIETRRLDPSMPLAWQQIPPDPQMAQQQQQQMAPQQQQQPRSNVMQIR